MEQKTFRSIKSVNPFNNQVIKEFSFMSDKELVAKIERSWKAFQAYKDTDIASRCKKIAKIGEILVANPQKYANLLTLEVGKPIKISLAEVQKCAKHCFYYVANAERILKPQFVETEAKKSWFEYHPMGPICHIIPFNNPFWLSFKGVIPALLIGNTILHREADTTPLLGQALEDLLIEAGFTNGEFQTVLSSPVQTELVLAHKHIRGVSFTGSTGTGGVIGAIASKYAKKAVMELGGSDPFVVLNDADLDQAVSLAMQSRLQNCGQVCSAGKRFIVDERVFDQFKEKLIKKLPEVIIGDPLDPRTTMGPLARPDLRDNIERQVKQSVDHGAKLLYGGKRPEDPNLQAGNFYIPAVVEVLEGDLLLKEETFGPVFALVKAHGDEELLRLANDTEYGLGCVIISKDVKRAEEFGKKIESGFLFVNDFVKSDTRMPSGGIKGSGFGRDCAEFGVYEFANIRSIWIAPSL